MKKLFYFFLPLLAFVACTDNGTDNNTNNNQGGGNQPVQNELTATPANLSFDSEEDSQTIDVYSTASWTAEFVNDRAKDWCSISPTNGDAGNSSILVSVKENTTGEERSASIVVKSGSLQKIVKVAQKQNDALTVTSSKFEVKAEGGEVEIEVKANIDYDYTIEESAKSWVKYKTTRAMETSTLVFDISENTSIDKREAKITFKSGNLKEVVTIYQDGTDYAIIISKDEYAVSDKGETITVEIKSNVDVVVEIPSDVDWVKESSSRAMSTNTYYFEISPNEDYNSRSTTIKFTNKENNLSESISITQAQKDAIVIAKDSYSLNDEGGNIDIEVGHNVDFDIEISDNWITQTTTRAFETETLRFNITANTSEDSREGTIRFISKDKSITQIVKVYQAQKDALIVSKKDITIDEQQQTVEFEVRANVEYTVSDPSAGWLHREETRAMTSQTIRYTVDANTSYDSRTATITVQSKDGSLKETISITQAQKDAIVLAKSSYNLENEGGNIDIEVGHNVDFDIEISDNWITQTTTRAFETETLTFNITANTSEDSRDGTIKFISKDNTITQTVTISQNGEPVRIITFADQYAKKVCVEKYDTNGDGELSEREAASVRFIDSNFFGDYQKVVKSFNEFKYFIYAEGIPKSAFKDCTLLKSIHLPKNILYIDQDAFANCDIEEVHIEDLNSWYKIVSVALISPKYDLYLNGSLVTDVIIPEGTSLLYKFAGCKSLKSAVLHDNITKIEKDAFDGCSNLESINIPNGVTEIGYGAFNGCSSLTNIDIPNSVTTIGSFAFSGCGSLQCITIPKSVKSLGGNIFTGCKGKLIINCNIPSYSGSYYSEPFWNNRFSEVVIGDEVLSVGGNVFQATSNITNNTLTSLTIGKNVILIEAGSFEGCTELKKVYCKASTPPIMQASLWGASPLFYVPYEAVNTYREDEYWKKYRHFIVGYDFEKGEVVPTEDPEPSNQEIVYHSSSQIELGKNADFGTRAIWHHWSKETSKGVITFDADVTKIAGAFDQCSNLTSITIPESVKTIGEDAFRSCTSLTTITIPDSVTTIGNSAFSDCKSLTSVTIGDNVTTIGDFAFQSCSSLKNITIGDSVTTIGQYAFGSCSSLTSITIGDSVTEIGEAAFYKCSSLTSVTIPDSVTTIGRSAFSFCSGLKTIYCKATTPPILNAEVFNKCPSDLCIFIPIGSLNAYNNSSWSGMNLKEYNFDE